jgi:nucleotide-binding universal stress UspA family protein
MTPYKFENPLVAIDGSDGAQRALDCALSLIERLGGQLTALIVEGKLPAYAATAGEVEEVKREKDHFFELGSTADRVAHNAHCPVIVVR